MPDFDTRTRQDPNEPNSSPRGPSMAGRVRNRPIARLRLAPTASFALAHVIVVVFWAYIVSEEGVTDYDTALLRAFLITAIMIGLTAILTVPLGAFLGEVDAAARRSSHPLMLVVDALLIVLFALVWIVPFEILLSYGFCDVYTCTTITPGWPEYVGVLIGAELGLVMLMVVSVRRRRR
jgi:hypothetical protein